MFITLRRETSNILLNANTVQAFVSYSEAGKECGSFVHFENRKLKPIWVMESVDEILAMLAGGRNAPR
jgi:hypothetical protein